MKKITMLLLACFMFLLLILPVSATDSGSITVYSDQERFKVCFVDDNENIIELNDHNGNIKTIFTGYRNVAVINFEFYTLTKQTDKIKVFLSEETYKIIQITLPTNGENIDVTVNFNDEPDKPIDPVEPVKPVDDPTEETLILYVTNCEDVKIKFGYKDEKGKIVSDKSVRVINAKCGYNVRLEKDKYQYISVEAVEYKEYFNKSGWVKIKRNSDDGITVMHIELTPKY